MARTLVAAEKQKMQLPQYGKLALNGDDVMRLGVPAGPEVGKILKQLEECVIEDPSLNTKEKLQKILEKMVKS